MDPGVFDPDHVRVSQRRQHARFPSEPQVGIDLTVWVRCFEEFEGYLATGCPVPAPIDGAHATFAQQPERFESPKPVRISQTGTKRLPAAVLGSTSKPECYHDDMATVAISKVCSNGLGIGLRQQPFHVSGEVVIAGTAIRERSILRHV
jgi:hypothetical protein